MSAGIGAGCLQTIVKLLLLIIDASIFCPTTHPAAAELPGHVTYSELLLIE